MNDAPLRLGLVGCGRLAEFGYAPASRAAGGVEIVAVADSDRKRRGILAAKLGASSHARLGELLAATPLHGLIVCTPTEEQEEVAALAAEAGICALVEAPASDADAALRIAGLNPHPWAAFHRRFDQGRELAPRVPPGGDLTLRMVLHKRDDPRADRTATGALPALAPHLIDLALFLTRSLPLAVRANAARDRAGLVLATTRAEVQIECATDRPHHELVEIRSAGGRLIGRSTTGAGRTRGALARMAPGAHPLVRSLMRQLEAYGQALRGHNAGHLATAAEGAAVMCVLDAARRSDAVGGDTVAVEGVTVA